ncbi:MAG: hypothetical protein IPH76_19245 [Xanthomonadales bacterium]|nr:hypothetical protein [Xanthomonadales bacterium]
MLEFQRAKAVLLKLLVAFALLFGAVQGFRLLLLPALQTLFTADAALTSVIRRCGILLCALFAYWIYVRGFERPVRELRPAPRAITAGALAERCRSRCACSCCSRWVPMWRLPIAAGRVDWRVLRR